MYKKLTAGLNGGFLQKKTIKLSKKEIMANCRDRSITSSIPCLIILIE